MASGLPLGRSCREKSSPGSTRCKGGRTISGTESVSLSVATPPVVGSIWLPHSWIRSGSVVAFLALKKHL